MHKRSLGASRTLAKLDQCHNNNNNNNNNFNHNKLSAIPRTFSQ